MARLSGTERQRYVARLFSRISGHYDLMNDLMTLGMHRVWKRKTATLATQASPGPALDVSTGTGDLAFLLARRPTVKLTVAVDLLPEMLLRAKDKGARLESRTPSFLVGDALSLPFPASVFASATAGFSLRNMPDVQQAVAEMTRVVGPGGRVALLELSPMESGLKARLFRFYFHRFVPLVGSLIARDRAAYTYLPQSVDTFYDADELVSLMRACGLVQVQFQRLGFGTVCIHWGDKPVSGPDSCY